MVLRLLPSTRTKKFRVVKSRGGTIHFISTLHDFVARVTSQGTVTGNNFSSNLFLQKIVASCTHDFNVNHPLVQLNFFFTLQTTNIFRLHNMALATCFVTLLKPANHSQAWMRRFADVIFFTRQFVRKTVTCNGTITIVFPSTLQQKINKKIFWND